MTLLTAQEALRLKLRTIPGGALRYFARTIGVSPTGKLNEVVERLLSVQGVEAELDKFVKSKYLEERVEARRRQIGDEELRDGLARVGTFSWGIVQGQLDQRIQTSYVRRFGKLDDLLEAMRASLYQEVANYVICTWFNHWTTVLIEEHIALHPRIIPALKSVKGVDLFFCRQPFDLKVTYLPKGYDPARAIRDPRELAVWMYENQGTQRFGSDNRFYVVVFDPDRPEDSWKLKRDFDLLFERIDKFLDEQSVTEADKISFTFGQRTYEAIAKVLLITKP